MEKRVALDAVGTIFGTDKSSTFSNSHDYLRHYEFYFTEFRDQDINLIEIGVLGGRSLKAWKWFFPRAQIVGIDINERCLGSREERIDIIIGSQADADFLKSACAKYPPTIVIDDGSHLAEHIIVSFEAIFPLLAPGGLYVVEDLNCHFGGGAPNWQTETKCDAPGYFMNLALARVAKGGNVQGDGPLPSMADIDSVSAFGGCVIIRKAHQARDTEAARAAAAEFARTNKLDWGARCRLALFTVEHGGRAKRAQRLMTEAVAKRVTPEILRMQALVEMAAGDAAAATPRPARHRARGRLRYHPAQRAPRLGLRPPLSAHPPHPRRQARR